MALRALAETEKALVTNHDDPSPFIGLGEAHAILGHHERAVGAARQALPMRPPSRHAWAAKVLQIDCVMRIYVRAGAFDDAIEALDDYLGTRGGCWSIQGLLPDPRLDPIRGNPRFVAL
jgi:hypothetical protein